jgi:hypothetical protein
MPLRIELVCMKSEGNLDVNAIEEPGHQFVLDCSFWELWVGWYFALFKSRFCM